jgi:hypothetical protein
VKRNDCLQSDKAENIMLLLLRRIEEKVDRLGGGCARLKQRMTLVEVQLADQSAGGSPLNAISMRSSLGSRL